MENRGQAAMKTASAFYNPTSGRWSSLDPIDEGSGTPDYVFVDSSPATFLNKEGLLTLSVVKVIDEGACKSHTVYWKYSLGNPAPCDGYFIQDVNIYFDNHSCCETAVPTDPPPSRGQFLILTYFRRRALSWHGPQVESRVSRRDLSRHESR